MPRAPSFKTTSLADLFRQLRFAPPETRERQMLAAEALAADIEPLRAYPEEFVIYRITRYRAQSTDDSPMLVGAAVLSDLATLVQMLSATLELPARSRQRGEAIPIDTLAERLGIAARTVRRYHKRGLLLHYVTMDEGGEARLACYEASLIQFQKREPALIERAGNYSRLGSVDEQVILDQAIQLHRDQGLSTQQIARVLAAEHKRGVETVRALLARGERESGGRLFKRVIRLSVRDEAFALRCAGRGVPVGEIARHLKRSVVTIRRCINGHRSRRLRDLSLRWTDLPTFTLADAASIILAARDVRVHLGPSPGWFDGIGLIELVRALQGEGAGSEESQLAGYNILKRQVAGSAATLAEFPADEELERFERDLRWAALLKRTIVFLALPSAFVRLEQNLARPLHQQSTDAIRRLINLAIHETSQAVEVTDPSRDQRVDRIASLAIDKALAKRGVGRGGTAGVRHAPASVPIGDPFANLCPWQPWIELPARLAMVIDQADTPVREVVRDFHGLAGSRPLAPAEIAAAHGLSLRAVRSRLSTGLRALRRLRATAPGG